MQRRLEFVQSVLFLKVAHGLRDVVLGAMLREISLPFLEHVFEICLHRWKRTPIIGSEKAFSPFLSSADSKALTSEAVAICP